MRIGKNIPLGAKGFTSNVIASRSVNIGGDWSGGRWGKGREMNPVKWKMGKCSRGKGDEIFFRL